MSIQKKSLISTLKTARKANVASSDTDTKGSKVSSMVRVVSAKSHQLKGSHGFSAKTTVQPRMIVNQKVVNQKIVSQKKA
jgi:hypothetical protein